MPSPTQLHARARVLLLAALAAIAVSFGVVLLGGQALGVVLGLLILAAVLFIASVVVRRKADGMRYEEKRD